MAWLSVDKRGQEWCSDDTDLIMIPPGSIERLIGRHLTLEDGPVKLTEETLAKPVDSAEEYLNKHCKPDDWDRLEERLKDSLFTNNVIEYMEQYAAQLSKPVEVTDEEIHSHAQQLFDVDDIMFTEEFEWGAKWMRERMKK